MKKQLRLDQAHMLICHGPSVLITSSDGIRANIMPVAWTTPINWEPAIVGVVIGDQAYTQKNILMTKEFAINVPPKGLLKETVFCGKTSGSNTDKFKETGLTKYNANRIKTPLIKECIGHIECRVIRKYRFGDAILFIGKVVSASVNKDLFGKYFKVNRIRGKTIHHLGGKYFIAPGKLIISK